MNKARILVLAIALGAGTVAWYLAGSLGRKEEAKIAAAQPQVNLVKVLVASRDIQPGQSISSGDVAWQEWPQDSANDSFLTERNTPNAREEIAGNIARGAFVSGEPIRRAKIVKAGQGGYLSAVLPSGMRAISTKTSPQTGAGGFILPNDRVDVILTRREREAKDEGGAEVYVSETVLDNVRVLAIDQTVEEKDGNKVVVGSVATLELGSRQAEILALAEQLGEISLALRSIMDGKNATDGDGPEPGDHLLGGKRRSGTVTVVKYGVSRQVTGTN